MEIILLEDVKSLGKKGEVVKINDGYARNFIIPKKLGVEATNKARNELKQQKAAEEKRQQEIYDEAAALGDKLKAVNVKLEIKTGDNGKVFGSVSTKEIAAALKEQYDIDLDKKKMVLNDAIKNVGTYKVPVKLHPRITVEMMVTVAGV